MKIKEIKIGNWRSIREIEVKAENLMVLIGQNNHGKSNLLSAVLFFFGEIKHQDLDFYHGSTELYVEIKFRDLDESDKTTFKKYLSSQNEILVRKTAFISGSFEYRGYIENPSEEWLQEVNAGAYTKRELAESFAFHPFLPEAGRLSKQNIIDAQVSYIEQNRDELNFTFEREETNFLGLKNVAKGIFGEVYFIPAVKDAIDDFAAKDTSTFGQLYASVIQAMSESNPDWKDTKSRLSDLFNSLNKLDPDGNTNKARPDELTIFEDELTAELSAWGAEVEVEIQAPDIDSVFKSNTQVWVNDGVRTDIRRKGHGLQRALTVALIQVVAKRAKAQSDNEREDTTGTRKASNSRYFIFEEPELYLHPQAQRSLFDTFVELSESGNQVLLCTHSSGLINVEKYKSIFIVSKESDEIGSKIKQCTEELFDGDDKKNFNLSYWVNPDRGELFFATKVVLVEGATDKTVIPLVAKQLGIFRYDYTFIDCGSKDSIPLYIRLLNKFSIRYIAVYDFDHQAGKSPEAINSANASSQRIEDEKSDELGQCLVLVNDIEEEIGLVDGSKNKPYAALKHISANNWTPSDEFESKVRTIFDAAL